ncbi:MAG: hypothetical protein JW955_24600 [Sedimentisphaerales bacterium]|nr:hypothetical protein [Sedimentisphaerales bacterium]
MKEQNRDDLRELFDRFLGAQEGRTAVDEVRRAERLLELYPAPQPDLEMLADVKRQVAAQLARRCRFTHMTHRLVPAAAAAIVITLIGLWGRGPTSRPQLSYASLIPAAIWESDDINSDDAELAYFAAEIEQIEAQMRALEAGEGDSTGTDTLHEVEAELLRLDTGFWKE